MSACTYRQYKYRLQPTERNNFLLNIFLPHFKNMLSNLTIRSYQNTDCREISELFYNTVHAVNAKDYTTEQLFAWAKDKTQLQKRNTDLLNQNTLIAKSDNVIVGFGSITNSGYLDLLFVHKDFQGRGIAAALCDRLEKGFSVIKTHASITAKPFFEKRGYVVTKTERVKRNGIELTRFEMKKISFDGKAAQSR